MIDVLFVMIIMIIISLLAIFYHRRYLMDFHWSLSDSKSPQIARNLLIILANFKNAVNWIVSIRPPISNSFRPLSKNLETVPSAPIKIGTTVNLKFYKFLSSLARSEYLSLFSLSLISLCCPLKK